MFVSFLTSLHALRKQQWLSLGELEEIQERDLKKMVRHAYEKVPYYHTLFDSAGIKPDDIKGVSDLGRVPITTRLQMQNLQPEEILARGTDGRRCKRTMTSGSSGIPLVVYLRKRDSDYYAAVWARTSLESGQKPWDRTAYVRNNPLPRFWFEHLGIWKKHFVLISREPEGKLGHLKAIRPDVIRGCVSYLADEMREGDTHGLRPRLIFSMGSVLDDESRNVFKSSLGAEVFDFYGAIELGCIAWECSRHMGYHVNIDNLVLELVKDGRPARAGETGRVICTGLHSFAMPFIRYDLGDTAILSDRKCSCGRGLPLLERIEGRTDDFLVCASGRVFSPPRVVGQFRLLPGVSQFKAVQEKAGEVTIQVVPKQGYSGGLEKKVREVMAGLFGNELAVKVTILDRMPPDPSGKLRSVVSNVRRESPERNSMTTEGG